MTPIFQKVSNFNNKHAFQPVVVLIEKWNRMVDIMNCRDDHSTPKNGDRIQKELLSTLRWFVKWNKDHNNSVEKGKWTDKKCSTIET